MTQKIDKMIQRLEEEIEYYNNPPTYQDAEYYVRCSAKVCILEDMLAIAKSIKEEA